MHFANHFINYLRGQGFSPLKFNLITDDFPSTYDFIFCWAVLVHFTKLEAISAMQKIYRSLNTNGRFAFCVKHKDGHEAEWEDYQNKIGAKRYFSYWDKDELEDTVRKIGFKNIRIYQYGGKSLLAGMLRRKIIKQCLGNAPAHVAPSSERVKYL